MTKFTDLQDARAAALARHKRQYLLGEQFCDRFAIAFAEYLELPRNAIALVGPPFHKDSTGRVIRDPRHTVGYDDDGGLKTLLVFNVDETPILVPISLSYEQIIDSIHATVGGQQFDLRQGYESLASHIIARVQMAFSSSTPVASSITL
jgi:hypothetical protein